MAVVIDSGEIPSAVGVSGSYELSRVVTKWQRVASGSFREDCSALKKIIHETDALRLWEKSIGGFSYGTRDEFLRQKVLLDFDLTQRDFTEILSLIYGDDEGGASKIFSEKQHEMAERIPRVHYKYHVEGKTQQQVADELGVSQDTISKDLKRNTGMPEKVFKPRKRITYQIQDGTKPATAAQKIREKFGNDFADRLRQELT